MSLKATDTKDFKLELFLLFCQFVQSATLQSRNMEGRSCTKVVKRQWKAGKCKIQCIEFLYFYEHHVFAYDIFEIQFGTCPSLSATFLCRFARRFADISFRDLDDFFLVFSVLSLFSFHY